MNSNDEETHIPATVRCPPEIWGKIFRIIGDIPQTASAVADAPSPIFSILRISHVNIQFRELVLNTPQLWTWIPYLNDLDPQFIAELIRRSHPHPLRAAFFDNENSPLDEEMWDLLEDMRERIGVLCIKVPPGSRGSCAINFLRFAAPSLRKCSISFTGWNRMVGIEFDDLWPLFDSDAPNLESIELLGCEIFPPDYHLFPRLSELSVHRHGVALAPHGPLTTAHGLTFEGLQSCNLRVLDLKNCLMNASAIAQDADQLHLPLLETLSIAAPHLTCIRLAAILVFPNTCCCSVTFLFPPDASIQSGEELYPATREALLSFIFIDEAFDSFGVTIKEEAKHEVWISGANRSVSFSCDFEGMSPSLPIMDATLLSLLNFVGAIPFVPMTRVNVLMFHIWVAFSHIIPLHLSRTPQVRNNISRNLGHFTLSCVQQLLDAVEH